MSIDPRFAHQNRYIPKGMPRDPRFLQAFVHAAYDKYEPVSGGQVPDGALAQVYALQREQLEKDLSKYKQLTEPTLQELQELHAILDKLEIVAVQAGDMHEKAFGNMIVDIYKHSRSKLTVLATHQFVDRSKRINYIKDVREAFNAAIPKFQIKDEKEILAESLEKLMELATKVVR